MNTSVKDSNISIVTAKLFKLILKMPLEERLRLLTELERKQEGYTNYIRRKYERKDYLLNIDYVLKDRFYNGFAINLSASGIYIEAPKGSMPRFSQGDQIILSFDHPIKQEHIKINGKIARVNQTGIGVMFDQAVLDWWTT